MDDQVKFERQQENEPSLLAQNAPPPLPSRDEFEASHQQAVKDLHAAYNNQGGPPPLPPGYKAESAPAGSAAPPLPAGYKLEDSSTPDKPIGEQPASAGGVAKTMTDQAGRALSSFWEEVNPVAAARGLVHSALNLADTAKQYGAANTELAHKAKDAFQKGDYAMATHHAMAYLMNGLPGVGSTYDKAAEQANSGDVAGSLGTTAGLAANLAAPQLAAKVPGAVKGAVASVAGKVADAVPERLYQSALKPPVGESVGDTKALVQTGLNNQIPVSEAGVQKLSGLIDDLSAKIKDRIRTGANSGATIDPQAVANRTDQLVPKFKNQVNPKADVAAIDASKQEFLTEKGGVRPGQPPKPTGVLDAQGNMVMSPATPPTPAQPMPADVAQDVKVGTYQQLRKKYGELSSAQTESEKTLARGIKEELETHFPELKGLNAEQGAALELQPILERAVNRISNHQLLGIGTPIAASAGAAVGGMFGGVEGAATGAVAGLLKAVLDDPVIKSRIAIGLHRGSQAAASAAGSAAGRAAAGKTVSVAAGLARVNAFVKGLEAQGQQLPQAAQDQQPAPETAMVGR